MAIFQSFLKFLYTKRRIAYTLKQSANWLVMTFLQKCFFAWMVWKKVRWKNFQMHVDIAQPACASSSASPK